MQRVSTKDLARRDDRAPCYDCGRKAAQSGNQTWTLQGSNYHCAPCSEYEGLY